MKLLLISLFMISFSHASTISSLDECTVALYKSNPWKHSYVLKGSRLEGESARIEIRSLLSENASLRTVVDELGVKRYQVIQMKSVLDRKGNDIDSCEGVYSASRVNTCTVDAKLAVCEISCELKWQGMDCR